MEFQQFKAAYMAEAEAKNVTRRVHSEDSDLVILDYTERCVFGENAWNPTTMVCRDLIVNEKTGEFVAKPFAKFFNDHEWPEGAKRPDARTEIEATVKYDGVQAVLYRLNGQIRWAAEGRFDSKEAEIAQAIWGEKYAGAQVPDDLTLIVEVMHPETRFVAEHPFVDLILVGVVNRFTGEDWRHGQIKAFAEQIGMPFPERIEATAEELLERAKTMDHKQEGFVVRLPDSFGVSRMKIKSKRWNQVFRAIHLMSERQRMRAWVDGKLDEIIEALPEEFKPVLEAKKAEFERESAAVLEEAEAVFQEAPKETKKELALWLNENEKPHKAVVFKKFDGAGDLARLAKQLVWSGHYGTQAS